MLPAYTVLAAVGDRQLWARKLDTAIDTMYPITRVLEYPGTVLYRYPEVTRGTHDRLQGCLEWPTP